MTAINIRRAQAGDAPAIAALYRQLVSNPAVLVLPDRVAQLERDRNTALLVAESGGAVVGTVHVFLCPGAMFQHQPFGVIENLVVDAAWRQREIGLLLLREVERYCLAADCSKIMLLSSSKRVAAHRLFEKAGFSGSIKRGFVKYRRQFVSPGQADVWPS